MLIQLVETETCMSGLSTSARRAGTGSRERGQAIESKAMESEAEAAEATDGRRRARRPIDLPSGEQRAGKIKAVESEAGAGMASRERRAVWPVESEARVRLESKARRSAASAWREARGYSG